MWFVCRAVMWAGKASGVVVYFTDVKDLERGDSLRGNVSWVRCFVLFFYLFYFLLLYEYNL